MTTIKHSPMKTTPHCKSFFAFVLLAFLFLATTFEGIAQEKITEVSDFTIIVEKTDNGIQLKSNAGSAWVDLAFTLKNHQPKAIDEYGMTDLDNLSKNKDTHLADYLFTITKTETGIELKGIKGTAWTELKFSLADHQQQAINRLGMTILN